MIRLLFLSVLIFTPLFAWSAPEKGKILVVLSSASQITLKNGVVHPTGFYMNELLVPLKQAVDAGYTPVFANPQGTPAVMDKNSDTVSHFGNDEKLYAEMKTFLTTLDGLKTPQSLSAVAQAGVTEYAGILVPGGHAPMEDLTDDASLGKILNAFHTAGKPTALICHGPVALLSALPNAALVVKDLEAGKKVAKQKGWPYAGYKMTVFSKPEEIEAEKTILTGTVKYYPENGLTTAGGKVQNGAKWQSNVVRDRELVTGQNPASDKELGKAFVEMLNTTVSKGI